jgi:serpin B
VVARALAGLTGVVAALLAASPAVSAQPALEPGALARAENAFAADLWGQLQARRGNLAVSPASIATALAMTWGGARGETATQMARALHLDGDPARAHAALGAQIAAWNAAGRPYELRVANRLFGTAGLRYEPPFLELTRQRYGAPLEPIDFTGAPEPSRARINAWVASATRERIRDLLPPGSITGRTRLVLTNAVYFKGAWLRPFDPGVTSPRDFVAMGGARIPVPMMTQVGAFAYGAVDGVRVLELPYVGGELAMVVVLPDAVDGLPAVEARVTPVTVERWVRALAPQPEVVVGLPRFRIETPEAIRLKDPLRALGMVLAFEDGGADFGGISRDPSLPGLFIDDVYHKAFVAVGEEGTEAAAATAVTVPRAAGRPPAPRPTFVADHPFLFLLRDVRTGALLFWGRVEQPGARP